MVDVTFGAITAPLDSRLSDTDRRVMHVVAGWPACDINDVVGAGDISLDALCRKLRGIPRPWIFASVANLEDLGYLPTGAIR